LFTIGHSTHTFDYFLSLLKKNGVEVVIDVRSVPYSKFASQFNEPKLKYYLKKHGIIYISMGDELGARHTDSSLLFNDGSVNFQKVMASQKFLMGISRLEDGLKKGYTISLMCSEKNPLECHRFSLISRFLYEKGHSITHILPNLNIFHAELDTKLFNYYKNNEKVVLDLEKILKSNCFQETLIGFKRLTKLDLYVALNKLVAYNAFNERKIAV
jgi:uncharacterized protein (DUF488 family)